MVRALAMFVAVLLVPFAAFAASDEFVWSEPGVDPFRGDIAKAFERFVGIPPTARAKLVTKVKKSVVTADVLKKYISVSSMTKEEKEQALKLADGQPFFNVDRLARLGLPQALLAEITAKEIDASGYVVGEIAPGQKCDWMAFGRDKVVPRVVYKPAEKVREPKLKAHFFTEAEAGVKYTVAQPLVCDNLCFWRVEVGLVKRFEVPQPAVTTRKAEMAGPATQVVKPQFRLLVNLFKDRDDGFFRERYRAAKQQPRDKTAYRRAVLEFGHDNLIAERRSRPLAEAPFHVQVVGTDGTVSTHVLLTDETGQVVLRLPPDFDEVRVVPDNRLSDIIPQEGLVRARREDFQRPFREGGLTALQVWFIQAPGLERR